MSPPPPHPGCPLCTPFTRTVVGVPDAQVQIDSSSPQLTRWFEQIHGWLLAFPPQDRAGAVERLREALERALGPAERRVVADASIPRTGRPYRYAVDVASEGRPDAAAFLDALFHPAERHALLRGGSQ